MDIVRHLVVQTGSCTGGVNFMSVTSKKLNERPLVASKARLDIHNAVITTLNLFSILCSCRLHLVMSGCNQTPA